MRPLSFFVSFQDLLEIERTKSAVVRRTDLDGFARQVRDFEAAVAEAERRAELALAPGG